MVCGEGVVRWASRHRDIHELVLMSGKVAQVEEQ